MNESMLSTLELACIDLEAQAKVDGPTGTRTRRVCLNEDSGICLRLIVEEGLRGVMLEGSFNSHVFEQSTRALRIGKRVQVIDGKSVVLLLLKCTEPRLNDVFLTMIADIAHRLMGGETMQHAVVHSIEEFKELLRKESPASLSIEETIGLIGELHFLREIALLDPHRAIQHWIGPFQTRRDFESEAGAVEVKTTRSRDFSKIAISSLAQLDNSDGQALYLYAVSVERSSTGVSVPSLIDEISALPIDHGEFRTRLLASSYAESMRPVLADRKFDVLELRCYRIIEGFPRLTTASFADARIPVGVRDVRYAIDLSHAEEFRLSEDRAGRLPDWFIGGIGHAP